MVRRGVLSDPVGIFDRGLGSFVDRRGGLIRIGILIGFLVNNNWDPLPLFFKRC